MPSINLGNNENFLWRSSQKKSRECQDSNPGQLGLEAQTLPLCYAAPPPPNPKLNPCSPFLQAKIIFSFLPVEIMSLLPCSKQCPLPPSIINMKPFLPAENIVPLLPAKKHYRLPFCRNHVPFLSASFLPNKNMVFCWWNLLIFSSILLKKLFAITFQNNLSYKPKIIIFKEQI